MQISINHVRVTDIHSAHHDQLVDINIADGVITDVMPTKKSANKGTSKVVLGGKELWRGATEGMCVSPGWVDVFADYREPGFEHKETISSGLAVAAAGGFTDVLVAPNTQPTVSSKSVIQYLLGRAAGNAVNLHPIGSATQNADGKELAEMMDMRSNGAIAFSDGWKPVQNAGLLLKALEYVTAFGGIIVQIPVDDSLAAGGLMNEGIVSTSLGMQGVPQLAETLRIHRDIELLRYTNSKLHISGVSTAASLEMIKRAKAEGLAITCSVTPYHLALTEDALTTYDSAYKVSPPLRGTSDQAALLLGIADGTIDGIASHHRPHEWDAKMKEFEYAADGMAVQELSFPIIWQALSQSVSPAHLTNLLSSAPRRIFGLPDAGIEVGNRASLTLFNISEKYSLQANHARSASINNPFLGQEFTGRVIGICNNNQIIIN